MSSPNNDSHATEARIGFNISETAIKRPVTTIMLILSLLVLGFISYGRLSVELFPNVNFPIVSVATNYPGASSQEVELLVSKPIEEILSSINGVEHIRSVSGTGTSTVMIEFKLEKDVKDAANEVREKMALVRPTLPEDVDEPLVARVDPDAAPIINYSVGGPYAIPQLTDMVRDTIKPSLEQVEGVAAVNILGGQEREVQVTLDPELLRKYGISPAQISERLRGENLNFPSGAIKTSRYEIALRTTNAFTSAEQIATLPIQVHEGKVIELRELGAVQDTFKEVRTQAWLNGERAVILAVQKQSGANAIAAVERLNHQLEKLKTLLPADVKIRVNLDSSKFILESKEAALDELIVGGVLAILVIFLFLRTVRGTLIAAIAIPTSVISTYTLLYAMNFSLNMMTLMALALVVGILVDDAVVDLENIFRHIHLGKTPYQAAIDATNEIGLAVVATTFSIVAVFVPVAFMSGMVGQFFRQFGLTVSFAVLISLLVARTLTPTLAAYLLRSSEAEKAHREGGFFQGLASFYRDILAWALGHRGLIMLAGIVIFVVSLPIAGLLPKGFVPQNDRDEFSIAVQLPSGSSLSQTSAVLNEIAGRVRTEKLIKDVLVTAGTSRGKTDSGSVGLVALSKKEGRRESVFEIQKRLQQKLIGIPGAQISMRETRIVDDGRGSYAMNLSLRGDDLVALQQVADHLITKLHTLPIVTDTSTSTGTPQPEIHIKLDKNRAAALGVSANTVAATLRAATFGDIPTQMRLAKTDVDIRVRLTDTSRYDVSQLRNLGIATRSGEQVPLESVAAISYAEGPTNIERFDRRRQVMVYANTIPGSALSEIITPVEAELKAMKLPPTIQYQFTGEAERMKDSFQALLAALATAIVFIYIVLASQFEHFLHPLTIMMALPLSFVGAFLGLFIANEQLGMMSLIGVVMLMGLVTKNSILLVDYTITLRAEGHSRLEALLSAGPVRLRPILMTTVAMIAGMVPVAMRLTPGSEGRAPMAVAVIGGLITSTLLTLVVIPVFYTLMDDLVEWLRRLRQGRAKPRQHLAQPVDYAETAKPLEEPVVRTTLEEGHYGYEN